MRLEAVAIDWENLDAELCPFIKKNQTFLTIGKQYQACALSVYKGVSFVLVADDLGTPNFIPSMAFKATDEKLPSSWFCNLLNEDGVSMIVGPSFISQSIELYSAMIDLEPEQVNKFWGEIESLKATEE